jgi:peptidoglycan/LPS O-acetylase OafA/YrhL
VSEIITSVTPPPKPTGAAKRIPELDGLRGIAIFLVILCHYVSDATFSPRHSLATRIGGVLGLGTVGVDLFFILSGFLIGGILLNSRESPNYYPTFYLRRFFRIIPIYYSWLLLFGLLRIIAVHMGGSAAEEFRTITPYWAYFIFIQNYFTGSTFVQAMWLIPLWSLAVEEQFYLLAPPLVRMLSRERLMKFLLGVVVFSLVLRTILATFFGEYSLPPTGCRPAPTILR